MKKKVKRWVSTAMLMLFCVCSYAQTISVTGTITDQAGETMPGVNIQIKGTTIGTVTDVNGKYTISAPSDASILVFSFIGFRTIEMMVGDRREISIKLDEDTKELDEVVVIGYGTARKRDLTGAVSQVKAAQLENEKPQSVQDVLRGKVAGLNVGLATTAKGGGNLEVRGTKSIRDGSDATDAANKTREANYPLIVLDGVNLYRCH